MFFNPFEINPFNKSITALMEALKKKDREESKKIWQQGSESLREYCRGQLVSASVITGIKLTNYCLPSDVLLQYFELALSSGCVEVIKGIWDNNQRLHTIILSKYGEETLKAISQQVNNLDEISANQHTYVIPQPPSINQENNNRAGLKRPFSLVDSQRQNPTEIISLNEKPIGAKSASLLGNQIEKPKTAPIGTVIQVKVPYQEFMAYANGFVEQKIKICKTRWDNDKALQAWYCGKQLSFDQGGVYRISLKELIKFVDFISKKGLNVILEYVWRYNPLIRPLYRGEQVETLRFSDEKLLEKFRLLLSSHCRHVIGDAWQRNERLFGIIKTRSIQGSASLLNEVMDSCYRNLSPFMREYLRFLEQDEESHKNIKVIEETLKTMKDVQNKREAKPIFRTIKINFLEDTLERMKAPQSNANAIQVAAIQMEESYEDFWARTNDFVKQDNIEICISLWNDDEALQAWYCGKQLSFDQRGVYRISPEALIEFVDFISKNKLSFILEYVWRYNPLIRPLYRGEQVDTLRFSDEKLLEKFRLILSSGCQYVIGDIWQENRRLFDVIKNLNIQNSVSLLIEVMDSSHQNFISHFAREYLKFLEQEEDKDKNIKIITGVLEFMGSRIKEKYVATRIKLLLDTLREMTGKLEKNSELNNKISSSLLFSEAAILSSNASESSAEEIQTHQSYGEFMQLVQEFGRLLADDQNIENNIKTCKSLWGKDNLLQAWYKGKSINFRLAVKRSISLEALIITCDRILFLLSSKHVAISSIFESLLKDNPSAGALYRGERVTSSNTNRDYIFSDEELQQKFYMMLASHCQFGTLFIFHQNKRLQNIIKSLSVEESTNLLEKVINNPTSQVHPKTCLVVTYLEFLEEGEDKDKNIDTIQRVLKNLQSSLQKKREQQHWKTKHLEVKINLLEDTLSKLMRTSFANLS